MPPGLAALVLQAQVIFTVVIAAGVLRERPTAAQAAGVVVGSAGLVVVGLGRGGAVPTLALGLCLLAALSWGVGNVVSRASGATGGLALTVWSAVVVPLPLLALSLVVDGPAQVADGLAAVVPWVLLAPVVAMFSAALLLDQWPNAAELTGGAIMVAGVLVALRSGGRRASRRERREGRAEAQRPLSV
jgi:drug/metabolite transporter (DMT)-like permease